jgi:hypothetical protein
VPAAELLAFEYIMGTESSQRELLRQLEERLLQPEVRRSIQDVADLLADEFVEFGSSGRVFNKQQIIESLQHEEPAQSSMTEFRSIPLAPGVILTMYRVVRLNPSDAKPTASLRSSIWRLQDGQWKIVFHQGTRAPDSYGDLRD